MVRALLAVAVLSAVLTAHPLAQTPAPLTRNAAKGVAKLIGPINLNAATVVELASLPGIGEKTAARIIEYRQKNGPFKKIEELMNVQGIGEKSFLKLRPQITVASVPAGAAPQPK